MKPDPLPTKMQVVFLASRVNGAVYIETDERFFADWPKETWFSKRLEKIRAKGESDREQSGS